MRFHIVNVRSERILRIEANNHLPRLGISRNPSEVRLELGSHPIAQELHHLRLGRMMEYRYCPKGQLILSQVL